MNNGLYIALSRQIGLERQMTVVANNIANMNTPAFKASKMSFAEMVMTPPDGGEPISMVLDNGTYRDLRQGGLTPTGNPLDVAINGNGYFAVTTPDGSTRYTRAGHFRLDSERQLVDMNGYPVQSESGQAITIPQGDSKIVINSDGSVATEGGVIDTIGLSTFLNEQNMKEMGGGLYQTDEAPQQDTQSQVAQGMVEESNVRPITELTWMIDAQRQYQATQKLLQTGTDLEREAIERLAKLA